MSEPSELAPVLQMDHISKTFAGTRALTDVGFIAYGGEVHALVGENGAGKSTLMKVLAGALLPDPGGEIRIGGKAAAITDPLSAKSAGVAIIYQELALAPNLSVAENIYLGREESRRLMINRAAMSGCRETSRRAGRFFRSRDMGL